MSTTQQQLDQIDRWAAEDRAAPTRCASRWCTNDIEQPALGRPRRYCSDACKMVAHRAKKAAELAEAERHARQQARYELDRRRAQLAESRSRQVEGVVTHVLASIPSNSRVSTTQRKSLAEQITRQLELAGLIEPHPDLDRLDEHQFYVDPRALA